MSEPVSSPDTAPTTASLATLATTSPEPIAPTLPAPPSNAVGRMLRIVSGASESTIADFRATRNWYTALGGVILGTGCVAATSMWFAVANALNAPALVAGVIALGWGLFIVNLDRWLVSGLSGRGWQAPIKYIGRFAMALTFAFVIAEPLVLQVFATEIAVQVREDRNDSNTGIRRELAICNPVPGEEPAERGACPDGGLVLSVPGKPVGEQELADRKAQLAAMQKSLTADRAALARARTLAQAECNGTAIDGLTSGVDGRGPECAKRSAEATNLAQSLDLETRQHQVTELEKAINDADARRVAQKETYESRLKAAIEAAYRERAKNLDAPSGFLDKFVASSHLGQVSDNQAQAEQSARRDRGSSVGLATWAIRLLFIAIECLPIFVKMATGEGEYEKALRHREVVARRIDEENALADEARATFDAKASRQRLQAALEDSDAEIRSDQKSRNAARTAHVSIQIEEAQRELLWRRGVVLTAGALPVASGHKA